MRFTWLLVLAATTTAAGAPEALDVTHVAMAKGTWQRVDDLVPAPTTGKPGTAVGLAYAEPDRGGTYRLFADRAGPVGMPLEGAPNAFGSVVIGKNPFGLDRPAHLVEVTFAQRGSVLAVAGIRKLDTLDAQRAVDALQRRFEARVAATDAALAAALAAQRRTRPAGSTFGKEEGALQLVPTWVAAERSLEVTLIHTRRQLWSPPQQSCP